MHGCRFTLGMLTAVLLAGSSPAAALHSNEPDSRQCLRVYPVADLVLSLEQDMPPGNKERTRIQDKELMEWIRSHAAPRSWAERGGAGVMAYFPIGMGLVVRQTESVHGEIEALLARRRAEPEATSSTLDKLEGLSTGRNEKGKVSLGSPRQAASEASEKLIKRVYSVADLVVPVEQDPWLPPSPDTRTKPVEKPVASPTNGFGLDAAAAAVITEKRTVHNLLIQVIQKTVAPESWKDNGGDGTIQFFPLGMAFVINQTNEVQEEVYDLLKALRHLQAVEAALEFRIIKMPQDSLARLTRNEPRLERVRDGAPVMLDPDNVRRTLDGLNKDVRNDVMQSPFITVFNNQRACVNVSDMVFLAVPSQPEKSEPVEIGLKCLVRPVVAADRKTVNLSMNFSLSSVPKSGFITDLVVLKLDRVLKGIPAGQSVLMYAGKVAEEVHTECGPSFLRRIPYLSRVSVGYRTETRDVLLLLTPRPVVHSDEELIFRGELPPIPRP